MKPTDGKASELRTAHRSYRYRLRTLFLLITAVSGWLGWRVYLAHREECAVTALQELRIDVTRTVREPEWFWSLLGERFGQATVAAVVTDSRDAEKAICHLRALPDLEDVDLFVCPSDESRGADAELLLRREMPRVTTQRRFLTFGYTTATETVQVPDGAAVLLHGIKMLKERQSGDMECE